VGADSSQAFRLPTEEAWQDSIASLGLSEARQNELRIELQHLEHDLPVFFATRIDRARRRELVGRMRAFYDAAERLRETISEGSDALLIALPARSLEAMGLIISVPPEGLAEGDRPPDLPDRRVLGLKYGPMLLAAALKQIDAPIEAWLEQEEPDRGGREPDLERLFVIEALARRARAIIGRPATATANGPFAKLCAAVFHACNLDAEGLEDAMERVLRRMRKRGRNAPTR